MSTNKRIAEALEKIASNTSKIDTSLRQITDIYRSALTNNEANVEINKKHYNVALSNHLMGLINILGEDTMAYLDAVQNGELIRAQEIATAKTAPKKRGRKPKATVNEIKPEPKKRGRKPKQPQA